MWSPFFEYLKSCLTRTVTRYPVLLVLVGPRSDLRGWAAEKPDLQFQKPSAWLSRDHRGGWEENWKRI